MAEEIYTTKSFTLDQPALELLTAIGATPGWQDLNDSQIARRAISCLAVSLGIPTDKRIVAVQHADGSQEVAPELQPQ
jgi:hypothetical protein